MGSVLDLKHCVGPGWHPLLDGMHEELTAAIGEYEALQVKEKWGLLRVYVKVGGEWKPTIDITIPGQGVVVGHDESGSPWDQAMEIVHAWEQKSATVCEDCGEPGILRTDRFWLRTLCDSCA